MRIALVVATSPDGVIGRDGATPWDLPVDLNRFRAITHGHPVIMGRRTHESIGRPLPGRLNIVVSRMLKAPGVVVARSLREATAMARATGADEAMVVGGESLYRAFLPGADTVHLTLVKGRFEGDARFPIHDMLFGWTVKDSQFHPVDERHAYEHLYLKLDRVPFGHQTPGEIAI